MDYHWPPFGADIQIELWKNETKENDYFVRVLYLGKVCFKSPKHRIKNIIYSL